MTVLVIVGATHGIVPVACPALKFLVSNFYPCINDVYIGVGCPFIDIVRRTPRTVRYACKAPWCIGLYVSNFLPSSLGGTLFISAGEIVDDGDDLIRLNVRDLRNQISITSER